MNTVLITGGSRGIGAQAVRAFSDNDWQVAFTYYKSREQAEALARETGALALCCNAANEEETRAMAKEVLSRFHHIDALICNAGTAHTGLFQDMTLKEWDDLFALHVRGAFLATRELLPGMISRQKGSILYISSMWGQVGASCEVAYSACKAALIGMTKALAKETGPSQVRVNCIAPGVIQTDMLGGYTPEDLCSLAEETPLQRLGTPQDVAKAAYFLCSQDASFITGQVLGVNGGFVV
ncbi:MAG: SDR family oxidoreductase [Clostridiales bacterium]|nr:SDR family oxidoreductase [Clostridiales bacterium]